MITSEAGFCKQGGGRINQSLRWGASSRDLPRVFILPTRQETIFFFLINCHSFAINKFGLSFESLASLAKSGLTVRVLHPRGAAGAELRGFFPLPRSSALPVGAHPGCLTPPRSRLGPSGLRTLDSGADIIPPGTREAMLPVPPFSASAPNPGPVPTDRDRELMLAKPLEIERPLQA